MSNFYVYFHYTLDSNRVFYIGKGTKKRAYDKKQRSPWWSHIVNKHGYRVEIVQDGISEQEAYNLEIDMIALYRKLGYNLCNITDGGDHPPSAKGRTPWNKGIPCSEEVKKKVSEANKHNPVFHQKRSKEWSDNVSRARRNKQNVSKSTRQYNVTIPHPAFINQWTGEIMPSGNNFRQSCRKYGLDSSSMTKVKKGKLETYRGWRLL